jgi:hypothetical protein
MKRKFEMARPSTLPAGVSPRGLNIDQASEYWGCCPSTFKKLVKLGVVQPIDMAGFDRNIFDRLALDDAMTARARTIGGGA